MRATLAVIALAATSTGLADVIDVRQGTNIAVAVDPAGQTLVVDLLGGLWRLPVSGGGATMLTAPGSGIGQPRFAADGSRIVVERNRDGQWDLWLLDLPSGVWEQLTDTPFAERHPDFLDDGRSVVFTSDRSGREQLWTLDLTTRALRQLTDEPGASRFPTVSDTGRIAYVNRSARGSTLRLLDRGPVGSPLTASDSVIEAPSWRPGTSGRVLVYQRQDGTGSNLGLLIDADIPVERQLTRDEDVFVGRPAWLAPDEFVYTADGQLWRRKVASTERRPVHMFAGVNVEPPATPALRLPLDGTTQRTAAGIRDLTLSRDADTLVFAALGDLWGLSGRSLRRLTDDPDVDVEPAFIGEGRSVAFVTDRTGSFEVWRLDTDTGERRQITTTTGDVSSLWLSADGSTAWFLLSDDTGPIARHRLMRTGLVPGSTSTAIAGPFDGPVELDVRNGALFVEGPAVDPDLAASVSATATGLATPAEPVAPDVSGHAGLEWAVPASEPLVIRVGRLFDGFGNDYQRHVDIHIDDGRVIDIVARGRRPTAGRVLDFSDSTVLPGMVDVHVHHPRNDPRTLGLEWLRHGVTTVREITETPLAALERAESWASGRRPGPRLVIAPATGSNPADELATLERAPAIVSSGFVHARDEEAGQATSPIAANPLPLPAAGFEIALSPRGTTYQDTLAVLSGSGGYMSTGLSASLSRIARGESRRLAARELASIIERAQRSFGRIAIGSDAPLVPYGRGLIDEIDALVQAGIPTAQVLRWATAGGAMALGIDAELGAIEPGKLADLVVVDGDPLSRVGDLREVRAVVLGGRVVWGGP